MDLKRYVIMEKSTRKKMLKQLAKDTAFLERNNVMDYSLLMGIYFMKITFQDNASARRTVQDSDDEEDLKLGGGADDFYGGVRSSCIEGPGIYYFGLIDMMQRYSWRKRFETWWKQFVLRKDVKGISCVEPTLYRRRFMKYMRSIIISDNQYYARINLQRDGFGKESVMIYPPQKVLQQNMRSIYQRRRSSLPSLSLTMDRHDTILRMNAYPQIDGSQHVYGGSHSLTEEASCSIQGVAKGGSLSAIPNPNPSGQSLLEITTELQATGTCKLTSLEEQLSPTLSTTRVSTLSTRSSKVSNKMSHQLRGDRASVDHDACRSVRE